MLELIIVGGPPRSGTTLVQNILDCHSEIYGGPEFAILPKIAELRKSLYRSLDANKLSFFLTGEQFDKELRSLVMNLIEPLAMKRGKTRISEKTPGNVFYFEDLLSLFPSAHGVLVLRHPGAILGSLLRIQSRYLESKIPLPERLSDSRRMADDTHRSFVAGFQAHKKLPDRMTVVKYEDLVLDPEETIRELCKSVGVEFQAGMLKPESFHHDAEAIVAAGNPWYTMEEYVQPISRARLSAWQTGVTREALEALRLAFADSTEMLNVLGYSISW